MTKNVVDQLSPAIASSFTSCNSLDCFTVKHVKHCVKNQCRNHTTYVYYQSQKPNMNISHSNSSDLLANKKKPIMTDSTHDKYSNALKQLKLTEVECDQEDELEETCESNSDRPAVRDLGKDMESVGTKLSARIMNLTHRDFKKSVSYNRSDTSSYKISKLSNYDILFQKIKEVYKACSCKVCECLVGKSITHDICKCKPCECSDCLSYQENMEEPETDQVMSKDFCGCKHYSKSLAGLATKLTDSEGCHCKPCDCIECATPSSKVCNCDLCQCLECKSMFVRRPPPVIVAPVTSEGQRNLCDCSPCECIECAQRYEPPSTLVHERATGTIRQQRPAQCHCELCQNEVCEPDGAGSCKCDSRVIRKPVQRDTHDYDIRSVLLHNPPTCNKHDTIAMFATISNDYPSYNKDNSKRCTCNECECLVCSYNEDAINAIKSSQLFTPHKLRDKSSLNLHAACKCRPCECEICNSGEKKICLCDICACVNCARRRATSTKQSAKDYCECRPCECNKCDKMGFMCKRQRLLDKCKICKRSLRDDQVVNDFGYPGRNATTLENASYPCRDSQQKMNAQQESLSIYHALPRLDYPQKASAPKTKTSSVGIIRQASMSELKPKLKCPKTCNILKCDAYTQDKYRSKKLIKKKSMDCKGSASYFSDSSSMKTKSWSFYRENGSFTPGSAHNNKSDESSCNSSGYDCPDYLVQFPKSTVETCLKDVMDLNLDRNIKLDKIKVAPNPRVRNNCLNSASFENTLSGKQRLSQGYEDRKDVKLRTVDDKTSAPRKLRRKPLRDEEAYTPLKRSCSKKITTYQKFYKNIYPLHPPHIVRENISVYITKNKSTQTNNQLAAHIVESTSSINIDYERNNGIRKNFQMAKILKDYQITRNVYDYHVMNQELPPNIIQSDELQWKSSTITSPFGYLSKSKVFLKIDEDYKSIQNTLREAKAFSSDLMKILEKYEKDNREFESVTKKLKLLDRTVFNDGSVKERDIYDLKRSLLGEIDRKNRCLIENEHELQQIHLDNPSNEQNRSLQGGALQEKINENSQIFEKTTDLSNFTYRYMTHEVADSRAEEMKSVQNIATIKTEINTPYKQIKTVNQSVEVSVKEFKTKNPKGRRRAHWKYSKLMKRTIIISKKINVENPDTIDSKPEASSTTTATYSAQTIVNKVTSTSINTSIEAQSMKVNEATGIRKVDLETIMCKLDEVFKSTADLSVCTSIGIVNQRETVSSLNASVTTQTQDVEDRQPWSILKKNYNLVSKASTKSKGVSIFPALEFEIKAAVQSVSLQAKKEESKKHIVSKPQHEDSSITNKTVGKGKMLHTSTQLYAIKVESEMGKDNSNIRGKSKLELELKDSPKGISLQTSTLRLDIMDKEIACDHLIYSTTEDIERQVRDLLNLSVLQPIMKKLLNSDSILNIIDAEEHLPQIESSKSSCEGLKASFLGARRVSDHTVLVKWNLPRDVSDVQGYELLVDGRAVQKIISPSRRMAVVTCLPHADHVVLTLRTLAPARAAGHCPATSIIYHPRRK